LLAIRFFRTRAERQKAEILIVDLERFARWQQGQFPPDGAVTEDGFLRIDVQAFSQAEAKAWVATRREQVAPDVESDEEKKVAEVRRTVLIRISEWFDLTVLDPEAGRERSTGTHSRLDTRGDPRVYSRQ
jgi:hypothetical protein